MLWMRRLTLSPSLVDPPLRRRWQTGMRLPSAESRTGRKIMDRVSCRPSKSSWIARFKLCPHFFQKALGSDLKCPGQAEYHLDRRSAGSFLEPGNVAVLQAAERREIHLRPTLLRTSPDEDVRECQAEVPEILQSRQCRTSRPPVSLTIGKLDGSLSLTRQGSNDQLHCEDRQDP